jgi:hypothetical protein
MLCLLFNFSLSGRVHVLGFALTKEHLQLRAVELYEMPDACLEDVSSYELLSLLKTGDFTNAMVYSTNYDGAHMFASAALMEVNIRAIIQYCETDPKGCLFCKCEILRIFFSFLFESCC